MIQPSFRLLASFCLFVSLTPALASAADGNASARAQTLFDQGLAAARKGDLKTACPLFRASNDAEARTGTLLNLGTCYEKNWQSASAWVAFREAEALAHREGRADLEAQAKQKWTSLEPRLVRLTIQVPAASRIAGLSVTRDGHAVQVAEFDVPIPIDPGEHALKAEAPGHVTWQQTVVMTNASRETQVPALERGKDPVVSWWTTGRKVGVGVAATGVAALITGSVLGLVANAKYQSGKDGCPNGGTTDCVEGSAGKADSARSLATPATIFFVSGAVLAVGGGALVLFAKPARRAPTQGALVPTRVALDVSPGWLGLSGRFE